MTTLVLHIGWPKTGTSSLQAFCRANQRKLAKHGVLYPKSYLQGVGHHLIPTALMREEQRRGRRDLADTGDLDINAIADSITSEIDGHANIDAAIISSERFMTLEDDQVESIREAFSHYSLKVIFYLRRQDLFAKSIYAQNLRVLRDVPAKNILKHRILNYRERLAPWENNFSADEMILVPFESSQWAQGLELDFLARLGLSTDAGYTVKKPANERLSWTALEYLNKHLKPEFGSKRYWAAITILDKYSRRYPGDRDQDSPYSPQTRRDLLERFRPDNDYLADRYFAGKTLFQDPEPDLNEAWRAYSGLDAAETRRLNALFGRFG